MSQIAAEDIPGKIFPASFGQPMFYERKLVLPAHQ
jgi:hypothetical protein